MGNKLSTTVEKQLGVSIEKIRKEKEAYAHSYGISKETIITWRHINDITNYIKFSGGGNYNNRHYGQQPNIGYHNKSNYKLTIKNFILDIKSIKELIDAGKITLNDIPITSELFIKIQDGTATDADLVPTNEQIKKTTIMTSMSTIVKNNPPTGGGKRKQNKTKRNRRK